MDYKLVRLTGIVERPRRANNNNNGNDEYKRAQVYSLRSNAWRELDRFPLLTDSSTGGSTSPLLPYSSMCGSTFFNGVVHWCARINYSSDWRMLTFNMDTEVFEHVEFPQGWHTPEDYWYNQGGDVPALFVYNNESIAFVSYCPAHYTDRLVNIWTLDRRPHGNQVSWTKLHSISLPKLFKPLGFPNKQEFMYYSHDGEIILYHLLNHRPCVAGKAFTGSNEKGLCRASLVSINN